MQPKPLLLFFRNTHCRALHAGAFLIFLSFVSCLSPNNITSYNFAHLYKKDNSAVHPQYMAFHLSDNSSRVFYKINPAELLYKRTEDGSYTAPIRISYILYQSIKSKEIADSGSVLYTRMQSDSTDQIEESFDFKTPVPKDYILEITLADINRNQFSKTIINIEKSSAYTRQNFYAADLLTGKPLFKNHLAKGERFILRQRDTVNNQFYVSYYRRDFPLPLPPFSVDVQKTFTLSRDSLFTKTFNGQELQFDKEGFYFIQHDTLTRDGFTVFVFHENFPKLTSAENLLYPLRYLTTKKEFEELSESGKAKVTVDKFWLAVGGNQDRSKVLIRNYYTRVQNANQFFSSYLEGWKTDRGLIYIVFGPPRMVYKTNTTENWMYGEINNRFSLNFTFYNIATPFTDNDYNLSRAVTYENQWYKAVEMWRDGRINNNDN